ncbi:polymorphic toxin-type HINT domain-containing protein [Actinoplanes sp. TFC3]|uniref:polymorphic toxin-type HINT domain-containing protein n=1 Tax=Actinoplanes sp. TFC3 TaxID=1710355 RepID=UPI000835DECD|nr:polymorphic toxin-type HINT domain-containing protein [Actinoplanes sp. TFC3]
MKRVFRRRLAVASSVFLAATFLHAWPAAAVPKAEDRLKPHAGVSIDGRGAKTKTVDIPQMPSSTPATPVWPKAGTTPVDVAAKAKTVDAAGKVALRSADGKGQHVSVEVLDRAASAKAKRDVVLKVRPDETGTVDVSLDYSGFRTAYGADWSDRLRLVQLPDCALTTPDAANCQETELSTTNDGTSVSAPVTAKAAGTVVALAAADSSGTGDFGATSLAPSATWGDSGNNGAFNWSYPMEVPPSLGGPAPTISLGYSSQAVDGRTAATNNQPTWVGEGFGFEPGFIERRYASCADDNDDDKRKGNNTNDSGDECWGTDNATLSLNGVGGGELIYNASEKRWHTRSDDGIRVERLFNAANGDEGPAGSQDAGGPGEHWVVTATDGTKYYFGLNRLPGWTSSATETKSVYTVPVAGNQSGEPCNKTAFKDSFCNQAWRWNLDWVVDPDGNAMSYWYSPETNKYARYATTTDVVSYVRGGNVTTMKYGQRSGTAYGVAPMSVAFTTGDRCLTACTTKSNWTDTPLDQECTGTTCTQFGPTFWTKRRLATVTTRIAKDGKEDGRLVDRWTLTHSYPDTTDGTRRGMWLSTIGHTAWDASNVAMTVPNVTLTGVPMDNRVDTALSNGLRPMRWHRLKTITTETGGQIDVTYKKAECTAASKPTPETNTKLCFPVRWAPPDLGGKPGKEITDWFHKYVVESIRENDLTSEGEGFPLTTLTTYKYANPAWRYADDDGLTQDKYRTWSQWRGFRNVTATKGEDGDRTRTDTVYFQGMDGDRSSASDKSAVRKVTLTDSKGKATITDHDDLSGFVRETIVYNGPDGSPISGTISDPWLGTITATHKVTTDTPSVNARYIDTSGVWNWTALDNNRGDTWTHNTTEFDAYGMPTEVTEFGDTAKPGDEKCVQTDYVRDTGSAWMIAFPSQVRTFALPCTEVNKSGRVIAADEVIGATRTSYDDGAFGAAPSKGHITRNESFEDWKNNAPVYFTTSSISYDKTYGRPETTTDAQGKTTTTTYTTNAAGQITRSDVKNPLGWNAYNVVDPATGATTLAHDVNGRETNFKYDALGRLLSAWKPGRVPGTDIPDVNYTYTLRNNAASVVKADTLNAAGKVTTTYSFYDSLLRPVQTQTPAATVGMLVSDVFYDSAGRVSTTYDDYWRDKIAPSATRYIPTKDKDSAQAGRDNVLSWSRTLYDGAGRETNKILFSKLNEKWRASTTYHGDHVDTTPPSGGTLESKYVDPLGRTTEIRQYRTRDFSGAFDRIKYAYNAKGQLAKVTDPAGTYWDYGYDVQGRQNYSKDPDKGESWIKFNRLGQIETTKDARNQVLAFKYDDLGRKTGLFQDSATGTQLAGWTYDSLAGGLGVLASSSRFVDGNEYKTATTTLDTKSGRPTASTITIPANEQGLAGTYTYRMGYAPDGTPSSNTMPAIGTGTAYALASERVSTSFNDLGMPTTMSATISGSFVPAVSFTEHGELATAYFATTESKTLQVVNDYDPATRRPVASEVFRELSPAVVSWKEYKYNDAGEIYRTEEKAPAAGAEVQCWREDYLQRLTDAWTPKDGNCDAGPSLTALADSTSAPAPYWTSWTFTDGGDRKTQVEHKTPAGERSTSYTYPAANAAHPHFVTGTTTTTSAATTAAVYESDAAGNTTSRPGKNGQQALTWNSEGQLASVQDSAGASRYLYDADGNRLITTDVQGKTLYLPGQEIHANPTGVVDSCVRYYSYASKTAAQRTSKGLTWLVSDLQNTATMSVDATTQQVSVRHQTAYGENRDGGDTWVNDKGFLGMTVDKTGLVHIGAREYDAGLGRFISVDPLMDLTDPQQMLGYAYANNSPVNSSDPTGESVDTGWGNGNGKRINPRNGDVLEDGDKNGTGGDLTKRGSTPAQPKSGSGNGHSASNSGGGKHKSGDHQQKKCNWWCKSKGWVSDHKADIAGIAVGVVVGVGCEAAVGWTGVGAVGCGVLAGAAGSITHDLVEGGHSVSDMAGNAIVGGLIGGVTAGLLPAAGSALSSGVRSLITRQAAGGAARSAERQAAGEVVEAVEEQAAKSATKPASSAGKACHSFDPATRVVMASGAAVPIKDVKVGDAVLATDPQTGQTESRPVVELHRNLDKDLADVTVRDAETGKQVVLHTTQHHPFWSESTGRWTDAAALKPGEKLHALDGGVVVVTAVKNWIGHAVMRDLTVDEIHSYYVIAGPTSVLVHNCGEVAYNSTSLGRAAHNARVKSGVSPGRNVAAADVEGLDSPVIGFSKGEGYHSEEHILDQLAKKGIDPSRIRALYSDRQPCENCGGLLKEALAPGTPITWSVPWGSNPAIKGASNDLLKRMISAAG